MRWSCLTLACLLVAIDVHGQTPAPAQLSPNSIGSAASQGPFSDPTSAVFRTAVDLVALNVVVTDPHQQFVSGLSSDDFAVFEDGVQQDVSYFAATAVPLDMAILLDTSASMADKMTIVHKAAQRFVATLRPGDRAMVVDIKDFTKVLYPLSWDTNGAIPAILSTKAGGGTGLYGGLYLTLKELTKARRDSGDEVRRQAIVVLSDGNDTTSLISFDDVMDVAKQSAIATFTITVQSRLASVLEGTSGGRVLSEFEFAMKSLAQETGARSFFPTDLKQLDGVYGSIATELASQYAIAYTPKNPRQDGAFRRIVVQVTDHPGMRTRTRSGYMSPRPPRRGSLE